MNLTIQQTELSNSEERWVLIYAFWILEKWYGTYITKTPSPLHQLFLQQNK